MWSTLSILSGAGADRFWVRSMQKRERESEAKFCYFFCQVNNALLYRFQVGQISRMWIGVAINPFGTEFWKFPHKGSFIFLQKMPLFRLNFQQLATSGPYNSLTIYRWKLTTKWALYRMSTFHFCSVAMFALQALYNLWHFRLSVCPSVCHTPVLCRNDGTKHGAVCTVR